MDEICERAFQELGQVFQELSQASRKLGQVSDEARKAFEAFPRLPTGFSYYSRRYRARGRAMARRAAGKR